MNHWITAALCTGYALLHVACFLLTLYIVNRMWANREIAHDSSSCVPAFLLAPVALVLTLIVAASDWVVDVGRKHGRSE